MKFIDEARIGVTIGDGGNGSASMRREKFVPLGGSGGGDGGWGGSVWVVAGRDTNTLIDYRFVKKHLVCSGENGRGADRYGAVGEDVTLRMSVGTAIHDADTEELIVNLTVDDQCLCLAQGGEGGWGSIHFKLGTNRAPRQKIDGKADERRNLCLELKVLVDMDLLGMPNIGKSTLITVVSDARSKIAGYSLTTLHPSPGAVRTGPLRSLVVVNISGLIEDAAESAGLGHQSLQHLQRTRVLLYVVDLASSGEGVDLVVEAKATVGKLRKHDAELLGKSHWLVLNKPDIVLEDEHETRVKDLVKCFKWKGPMHRIPALTYDGTQVFVRVAQECPDELRTEGDVAAAASDRHLDPSLHNVSHGD